MKVTPGQYLFYPFYLNFFLEKIVYNLLLDFLLKKNIFSSSQHGFRPTLSTESTLLKVTDAIYKDMGNKIISLLP